MKMTKNGLCFENKDVLLLSDGRLLQIIEDLASTNMTMVEFIDKDEHSFVDMDNFHIDANLGRSVAILAQYLMARSIHLRLNKFGKV